MKEKYKQTLVFTILAAACFLLTGLTQSFSEVMGEFISALINSFLPPLDLRIGTFGFVFQSEISVGYFLLGLLFLVALGIYSRSRGKKTGLVSFLFSCVFILNVSNILVTFSYFSFFARPENLETAIGLVMYILGKAGWLFISIRVIMANVEGKKLYTIVEGDDEEQVASPDILNAGMRFWNYITDLILIICFQGYVIAYLPGVSTEGLGLGKAGQYLLSYTCTIVYYLIMESLFSATPGKYLTGSRVVNKDGSKPDFSTILRRTFSRIVPFEPLSAFNATPWHDTWTNTIVAKEIPIEDVEEVVENEEAALEY